MPSKIGSKEVVQGAAIGALCGLLASGAMNAVPAVWAELDPSQPHPAALAGHFAFGASAGALYGALARVVPAVTVGMGVAYATAVWLIGDKVLVPKLGLAAQPGETPAKNHLQYWLPQAVYGLTLDSGIRLTKKRLG